MAKRVKVKEWTICKADPEKYLIDRIEYDPYQNESSVLDDVRMKVNELVDFLNELCRSKE